MNSSEPGWGEARCGVCQNIYYEDDLIAKEDTFETDLCENCVERVELLYHCEGECSGEDFNNVGIPTECPRCGGKEICHATSRVTTLIRHKQDTLEDLADLCQEAFISPKLLHQYIQGEI